MSLNIFLELDEDDEWVFRFMSNMELALKMQTEGTRLKTVRNLNEMSEEKCQNCSKELQIKIFYTEMYEALESLPVSDSCDIVTEDSAQKIEHETLVLPVPDTIQTVANERGTFMIRKIEKIDPNLSTNQLTVKRKYTVKVRCGSPVQKFEEIFVSNPNLSGSESEMPNFTENLEQKSNKIPPTRRYMNQSSTKRPRLSPLSKYLPKGVCLPDTKELIPPFSLQHPQPDGTTAYLYRSSLQSILWITNFDLACLQCDLCHEKFDNINTLMVHRKNYHFFPCNSSKCVCCGTCVDSNDAKRGHALYCLAKNDLDISFCYICDTQLTNYLEFRQHLLTNHKEIKKTGTKNNQLRKCRVCEKSIDITIQPFHQHMHTHFNPFQCDLCPALYYSKNNIFRHLVNKHFPSLAKHKCIECKPPKYFFRTYEFVEHQNKRHNNGLMRISRAKLQFEKQRCKECNSLINKNKIATHMSHFHAESAKITCEMCGMIFFTQKSLKTHQLCHLPANERKYRCKYCPKRFNAPIQCEEHERVHTGEKPHNCEYCGKRFAKRQTFRDHLRTHTGNGYKCDHCERMFWDHSSFRKHLKMHEIQLGIKLTYTKEERRLKHLGLLGKEL